MLGRDPHEQWKKTSVSYTEQPLFIYSISALCQAEGLIINHQSHFILCALQRPDKKRNKEASQMPSERSKYSFSLVKIKTILQKVLTPLLLSSPTHFYRPELLKTELKKKQKQKTKVQYQKGTYQDPRALKQVYLHGIFLLS